MTGRDAVLTLQKIGVTVGDGGDALVKARYSLELGDSPQAFRRAGYYTEREAALGVDRSNALWLGSEGALERIGVQRGAEVLPERLALALEGKHTVTGEQVRRPGTRTVQAVDESGSAVDPDGNPYVVVEERVNSVDLTFSAPKSVSVVWSQAGPGVRAGIERAMMRSANAMLSYMTQTKPVLQGVREPGQGFAASAALQVTARRARGQEVPSPQLHVHNVLVGIEDGEGRLKTPGSEALFKHDAPLEGGAVARAVLAEELKSLGFQIDWGTGRHGRFFEIRGVSRELIEVWSARSREVERERARIERATGRRLSGPALAALAQVTRMAKDKNLPAERVMRCWDDVAGRLGFGEAEVEALRGQELATEPPEVVRERARAAIKERVWEHGPTVSVGMARAIAFEVAPIGLSLEEASGLLAEMQRSGELISLDQGRVTTREIRELERRVLETALAASRRAAAPMSDAARAAGKAAARRSLREGCVLDGDQLDAIDRLSRGERFATLTGLAGTGKTPVLLGVSEGRRAEGWRVIACAVDGSTAQRLGHDVGARAYTIEQVLYGVEHGTLRVDERTLVVVDEASKVGLEHWAQLAQLVARSGISVLAVGHTGQLGAIELPGMFDALLRHPEVPTATLTTVRRHRNPADLDKEHPWLGDYQRLLDAGTVQKAAEAIELLRDNDAITMKPTREEAIEAMVADWDERRREHKDPRDAILVVHGPNEDVDRVNQMAQTARRNAGDLKGPGVQVPGRGYRIFEGDVVIVRDAPYEPGLAAPDGGWGRAQRVENGTLGIVEGVDCERRLVWVRLEEPGMRQPRQVTVDLRAMREQGSALRLAYAFHPFPLQGATRKAVLVLDGHWSQYKEATYSADTRAQLYLHKYTDRESLGIDNDEEKCWELLAERWSTSQNRQASINLAATGGQIALELPIMHDPPEFPGRTRQEPAEVARAIQAAITDRKSAETRTSDPLEPYRQLLGQRRARLIEERARSLQQTMQTDDLGKLLELRGGLVGAFNELDPLGARETLALERLEGRRETIEERAREANEQANLLDARAQSGRHVRRTERRQLAEAADAQRRLAARDHAALERLVQTERELREQGGRIEEWITRHGDSAARAVAVERELETRRQLTNAAVAEWAVIDPPQRLRELLGPPPPKHAAQDRTEWETLIRELERDRLNAGPQGGGRASGHEHQRRQAELMARVSEFLEWRGLKPLHHEAAELSVSGTGLDQ
jgi:conjugative relaxase-like TrwC/TraI family protein